MSGQRTSGFLDGGHWHMTENELEWPACCGSGEAQQSDSSSSIVTRPPSNQFWGSSPLVLFTAFQVFVQQQYGRNILDDLEEWPEVLAVRASSISVSVLM